MKKITCCYCKEQFYSEEMESEFYECPHCNQVTLVRPRSSQTHGKVKA